jgi:hypothetical protein
MEIDRALMKITAAVMNIFAMDLVPISSCFGDIREGAEPCNNESFYLVSDVLRARWPEFPSRQGQESFLYATCTSALSASSFL